MTDARSRSEAQSEAGSASAEPLREYCTFESAARMFALDLAAVREVLSGKLTTPIPQAPPALIGVIALRGDVVPVVHFGSVLGLASRSYTPANPILVLVSRQTSLGIAVDRLRRVNPLIFATAPAGTEEVYQGWHQSGSGLVALLNTEALISHAVRMVATQFENRLQVGAGSQLVSGPGTSSRL